MSSEVSLTVVGYLKLLRTRIFQTITTILHSKKRTNKIPPPATSPATPPRVYLFTHTRVASNLLIKILNLAEQNIPPRALGGYFFIKPWQKPRLLGFGHKSVDLWAPGDIEMIKSMNQECYEDLISWLDAAAKDAKIGFVKEHTLCLIDPALKIPSAGMYCAFRVFSSTFCKHRALDNGAGRLLCVHVFLASVLIRYDNTDSLKQEVLQLTTPNSNFEHQTDHHSPQATVRTTPPFCQTTFSSLSSPPF